MTRARLLVASLAVLIAACGGTASTAPTSTGSSRGTSATTTGSTGAGSTATSTTATGTTASSTSTSTSTTSTSGTSTTGTTTSGTSITGTTSTSATAGTSTSGTSTSGTSGSCPGYALPNDPASCTCGRPGSCSANGCYNGYLCQLSTLRCVSPSACPSSSSTSSTTGSTSTTSTSSTTGTSGTTGTGTTTGTTGTSGTTGAPPYRVLFDSAHKQAVSNACWIIDSTSSPDPQPANPTSATDWQGAISSWGFDLFSSGRYVIKQLPVGAALNYGGGGPGDLSTFDVFVSDEPEILFSAAEQAAMVSFVNAGKGVMLISDHAGASRCSTCTQAATVINDFLVSGAGTSFGAKTDVNDIGTSGLIGNVVTSASLAPVFANGPFGAGSQFSYHSGTSVSVTNSSVAQVVVDSSSGGMIIASTPSAAGRFVLVGDSSPEEDGTAPACPGATVHNGWAEANDRALILNATAWLAHDGS